jgi:hypothetical protein
MKTKTILPAQIEVDESHNTNPQFTMNVNGLKLTALVDIDYYEHLELTPTILKKCVHDKYFADCVNKLSKLSIIHPAILRPLCVKQGKRGLDKAMKTLIENIPNKLPRLYSKTSIREYRGIVDIHPKEIVLADNTIYLEIRFKNFLKRKPTTQFLYEPYGDFRITQVPNSWMPTIRKNIKEIAKAVKISSKWALISTKMRRKIIRELLHDTTNDLRRYHTRADEIIRVHKKYNKLQKNKAFELASNAVLIADDDDDDSSVYLMTYNGNKILIYSYYIDNADESYNTSIFYELLRNCDKNRPLTSDDIDFDEFEPIRSDRLPPKTRSYLARVKPEWALLI